MLQRVSWRTSPSRSTSRARGGRPPPRSGENSRSSRLRMRAHEPTGERTWTGIRSTMLRVTSRARLDVHDRQQAAAGPRLVINSTYHNQSRVWHDGVRTRKGTPRGRGRSAASGTGSPGARSMTPPSPNTWPPGSRWAIPRPWPARSSPPSGSTRSSGASRPRSGRPPSGC